MSARSDLGPEIPQRATTVGRGEGQSLPDPKFVDLEKGDLRLKPDSPAWKLGFQRIDLSSIGLLPNHPYTDRAEANPGQRH